MRFGNENLFYYSIFLTYFFSFLPIIISPVSGLGIYGFVPDYEISILIIYAIICIFLSVTIIFFSNKFKKIVNQFSESFYNLTKFISSNTTIFIFSLLTIASSILMLLIFGSSSRHNADARISSAGILPLVLMFSSKYTQFTLLVRVVLEHYGIANLKGMKINFIFFLNLIAVLFAVRSALGALIFVLGFSTLIPKLKYFSFSEFFHNLMKYRIRKIFFFQIFIILISLTSVISIGFLNKSLETLLTNIKSLQILYFYLAGRISTHAHSFYSYLTGCWGENCKYFNLLDGIGYRFLGILNSSEYRSSEIYTPSRLNFLNTSSDFIYEKLKTSGSSPGLLASLVNSDMFIFGFLFVFFISILFICFMGNLLKFNNYLVSNKYKPLILVFIYYLLFLAILGDPLSYAAILTPSNLDIILLLHFSGKSIYLFKKLNFSQVNNN